MSGKPDSNRRPLDPKSSVLHWLNYFPMGRMKGIEPSYQEPQPCVLPLNYNLHVWLTDGPRPRHLRCHKPALYQDELRPTYNKFDREFRKLVFAEGFEPSCSFERLFLRQMYIPILRCNSFHRFYQLRARADLNCCTWFCRPEPNHSATCPYFILAERTGLEPALQLPGTGFQDRGDTNYALPFQSYLQKETGSFFEGSGLEWIYD